MKHLLINRRFNKKDLFIFFNFSLYYFLALISVSILLGGLSYILKKTGTELPVSKANPKNLLQLYGQYAFLIVAIIGPIIEESIFRLPLRMNKLNISVAMTCLFVLFWYKLHLDIQILFLFIAIIILLVILLSYKISESILRLYQIKYISYLST
jgi:membrane protease YdiL (CAAX protease family)